ncbi:MAG: hypothetical protein EBZ95_00115 [Chitinophagia bacterium]|nr:hypothetical protein [Chitinophagia bacterium]
MNLAAQTIPNFDLIKLEKISDYKKAEPFVILSANFILSTPFKIDNKDRYNSLRFISQWMNGTTDYSFVMNDIIEKIGKGDNDHLAIYVSALSKYTIENKPVVKDANKIKVEAMTTLLNYCQDKNNNLRLTKQLKKLAEAKEKGQLEQALQ